MSFINKALEKAKALQQQGKPAAFLRPEPPKAPLPPVDEVPGLGETPGEIHYLYTRRVAVDMEILRRHRLLVAGSDDSLGEAYKLLRTHVLQATKAEGRNTLMFTGPRPGEGKTLTVINLAIAISQKIGQTVLLVDSDLRNPSIHRYLDLPSGPGLIDYLTSGYPIQECLAHPEGLANLVVLPAGHPTTHAGELLSSPLMADLVREMKKFYPDRYVLFDLPPLLYADPLAFAPLVDGIIVVVEAGSTPRQDITHALEMLKGFPVLGLVLNKIDPMALPFEHFYQDYPNRDSQKPFKLPWLK